MSSTRLLYLFSALVFFVGAILAVVKTQPVAIAIFVGLCGSMLWIQSRVDKIERDPRPGDDPGPQD
jgi:positive regulator of sigma E activity